MPPDLIQDTAERANGTEKIAKTSTAFGKQAQHDKPQDKCQDKRNRIDRQPSRMQHRNQHIKDEKVVYSKGYGNTVHECCTSASAG